MKQVYSYEALRRIVKDAERKGKAGQLRPEEAALGTAAAYAADLMDYGKASGNLLDLTIMQEDVIVKCLSLAHMANVKAGKTVEQSREHLVKLLGGYELFAIANSMNCEGQCVEIAVVRSVMSPEIKLAIDSLPDKNGKTHRFDVYDAARQTVSEFQLGDLKRGDDVFFAGRMLTFHNRLLDELLRKYVE